MDYAELHLHDIYSAFDGTSSPEDYLKRAKELGIDYVAETNHGTHSGHRHFQRAAKEAGIIPILGEEAYFTADRTDRTSKANRADGDDVFNHITLLAQNETGLLNMRKLNEIAYTEGFYEKPRIDLEVLEAYNEGIIVLSGCRGGVLAKAIENNLPVQADQHAREMKRIFGERYFIEVMSHNPVEMNKGLLDIGAKYGFKHVVTSDCHHARKEDLWVQEAMLILSSIKRNKKNKDFNLSQAQKMGWLERYNYLWPDRKMTFQELQLHLNSVEEHLAGLEKHGIGQEAIDNTMVVARMIDADSYPYFTGLDLLPKGLEGNVDEILRKEAYKGLKRLGWDKNQVYIDRLEHELKIILDKGFAPYFLIALKAITWAREQGIKVGPGRGSGVGSLVCRTLELTLIDPIEHNLLFERFIDPDRPDWPDLDMDFEHTRREEVKAFVRRAYKYVASIATFGYFRDKGTVRDASRVLGIPLSEVNKTLKQVNDFEDYKENPKAAEFRQKYPQVEKLASALQGNIRSVGMHAGGLVVANRPLSDIVPVQSAAMPKNAAAGRVPVVAYDMHEIEEIGLIKFDFLGLSALTVIAEAEKLINERHNITLDLMNLPHDDDVYAMISQGHTRGVFQCSEGAYTRMLVDMGGVKNFDELVVSNALVRPGAADSSFGAAYIQGKNGGPYEFIHKDTEWFTRETYGQIIYQEQQMHLCVHLADMSVVESNKVRKAIGKKIPEQLAVWKPTFIEGAAKKIGQAKAEALWHDLEAAAKYSFNKSHAVAYSMLSYQTAWLKYHYPLEFITAALNSEDDKDKVLTYFIEAKRLGLRIKLPNINESDLKFSIQKDDKGEFIRIGVRTIKYVSDKIGARLIASRPYNSYEEFQEKVLAKGSGMNARVLSSCNAIGAATFSDNPKRGDEQSNYYEYLHLPLFKTDLPLEMKEQFRPLDEYSETEAFITLAMVSKIKTGQGWTRAEIVDETGTAGVFTNEKTNLEPGQMYALLIAGNRVARYLTVDEIQNDEGGGFQGFLEAKHLDDVPEGSYKVVAFNARTTRAGKRMANAVLSDADKNLTPVMIFPQQFMDCFQKMRPGKIVRPELRETDDGSVFVNAAERKENDRARIPA
jgi:DNA polymerase-3 subunit alpha